MDVSNAFLNAPIDADVYLRQPAGYVDPIHPTWVLKLKRNLYGTHQGPFLWYNVVDPYLQSMKFVPTKADPCIYIYKDHRGISIIALYVDDKTLICSPALLEWTKSILKGRFVMKDLGPATSVLGTEINYNKNSGILILSQGGYIKAMDAKATMLRINTPTVTLRSLFDSCFFLFCPPIDIFIPEG